MRKPTQKQREYTKIRITEPKLSRAEAVIKAGYQVSNRDNAAKLAYQLDNNPIIQSKLAKHIDLVENALVQTVRDWSDSDNARKREIALNQAQYIHDKVHGKATQKVEQNSTAISFTIDLTGN